jgi:branched-chain amino acid aminotransferase
MELATAAGIDCREQTLVRHDLYTADECFLTGTAAEVIPVIEIDGRKIGPGAPGPVTKRLTADFHELVRR